MPAPSPKANPPLAENPSPTPTPAPSGSKSNQKILLIILAVLLGLGLVSAIGGWIAAKTVGFGLKKAFESATGMKIDQNGGNVTFNGKNGEQIKVGADGNLLFTDETGKQTSITGGKSMPSNFPSDFPVASGMTVDSATSSDTPDGQLFAVSWQANDIAAARAFYEKELLAKGWTIPTRTETDGNLTLFFSRPAKTVGDEDGGWITIGTADGKASVTLWLVLKK